MARIKQIVVEIDPSEFYSIVNVSVKVRTGAKEYGYSFLLDQNDHFVPLIKKLMQVAVDEITKEVTR